MIEIEFNKKLNEKYKEDLENLVKVTFSSFVSFFWNKNKLIINLIKKYLQFKFKIPIFKINLLFSNLS